MILKKNRVKQNACNALRLTLLPEMSKGNDCQSALFIGNGNDDAVLVVGGYGGNWDDAALLTNRPHQVRAALGNRGGQWRWQCMSSIVKLRPCQPGLLKLGRGRVLVCGGGESRPAEILQLTR